MDSEREFVVKGESSLVCDFQMKLSISIAAAAVIGTAFIAADPAIACPSPYLAATVIKEVVKGGGTIQQAWAAARSAGWWDGSEVCMYRVRSHLK